jgi:hypothetical protein
VPNHFRVSMFVLLAWVAFVTKSIAQVVVGAPAPFDLKPWLDDLKQTREAIATKYANLEWVVIEREINLESLFNDAEAAIHNKRNGCASRF